MSILGIYLIGFIGTFMWAWVERLYSDRKSLALALWWPIHLAIFAYTSFRDIFKK